MADGRRWSIDGGGTVVVVVVVVLTVGGGSRSRRGRFGRYRIARFDRANATATHMDTWFVIGDVSRAIITLRRTRSREKTETKSEKQTR